MPLSEHEQRLLDEIERALYAEDPKFAAAVRATDLKSHLRRRIKRGLVLLVLGLVVLVVGAAVGQQFVGVSGFLVMLGAGLLVMRSWTRLSGVDAARIAATPAPTPRRRKRRGSRPSLRERFDDRIRRRWEDRE